MRAGALVGIVTLVACGGGDAAQPTGLPLAEQAEGVGGARRAVRTIENGHEVSAVAGYVRPVARDAVTAGYLTLQASADDALLGANSSRFGAVELHRSVETGGVSRMRQVAEVPLPAGRAVALEPGGYHLMMTRASDALAPGALIPVTLDFASGAQLTIELPVSERSSGAGASGDHSGH